MNNAEKKALAKYEENKGTVLHGKKLPVLVLCDIAKQQDRLYRAIFARQDNKYFHVRDIK